MKVLPITKFNYQYNCKTSNNKEFQTKTSFNNNKDVYFKSSINFIDKINKYLQYKNAQKYSDNLYKYITDNNLENKFLFRHVDMDKLEGLQYGIDVFKNMTMRDLEYTSEFLHIIAVKRGCKHMCAHCYADARPSNREMSFEDFSSITNGFKEIRKRLHGLDIYGNNIPQTDNIPIFQATELFYDADCMDIILKDKKGIEHDFTELPKILFETMGRKTVFDTSGWYRNNKKMQERAEKYAQFYSKPENIKYLKQFNISFNPFNASYIASRKALDNKDYDKAKRLKDRFLDDMANSLFTFTPVAHHDNFNILVRAFKPNVKNSNYFNVKDMTLMVKDVLNRLSRLYLEDLNGEQKLIKSLDDYNKYIKIMVNHFNTGIDTSLNSSGRMKQFIKDHNIKNANLQNHEEITPEIIEKLQPSARLSKVIHQKLIDTDGKVYYFDYARIIPTEIQLNINDKDKPTPKFTNLIKDFIITKENVNYKEK